MSKRPIEIDGSDEDVAEAPMPVAEAPAKPQIEIVRPVESDQFPADLKSALEMLREAQDRPATKENIARAEELRRHVHKIQQGVIHVQSDEEKRSLFTSQDKASRIYRMQQIVSEHPIVGEFLAEKDAQIAALQNRLNAR